MPIIIEKEPKEVFETFGFYENCKFCKNKTDTWNKKTNTPVCTECSKIHNQECLTN